MTAPEGEIFIEVHADTKDVEPDLRKGLKDASEDVEKDAEKDGDGIGKALAEGIGKSVKKSGPKIAKDLTDGLDKVKTIKTKTVVQFDRNENVVRKWVTTVTEDLDKAVQDAGRPGGPLARVGRGIADAIGAGFNVSGQSPLVPFLAVAVIPAIIALVIGAIQAVNALVAVLTIIPSLLLGIVSIAGITTIAFQGMGTAIQGAFAATNAQELREALEGLTPAAQTFVKSLLPLKPLLQAIKESIQQNFFRGLGDIVKPLTRGLLNPAMVKEFNRLAGTIGGFFRDIALFFASPNFTSFLKELLPATGEWLKGFGPAFVSLLRGLIDLANAAMPFLRDFGTLINNNLKFLGDTFSRLAKDPKFQVWLDNMMLTLSAVLEIVGELFVFLSTLFSGVDAEGGLVLLEQLGLAIEHLSVFLASPVGREAIEGLINLAIGGIIVFTGLLEAALAVIAAVNYAIKWLVNNVPGIIKTVGTAISDFMKFIINGAASILTTVGEAIRDFAGFIIFGIGDIIKTVGTAIADFMKFIINTVYNFLVSVDNRVRGWYDAVVNWLSGQIRNLINIVVNTVIRAIAELMNFFNRLKAIINDISGFIRRTVSGYGTLLFDAGWKIIKGLTDGIKRGFQDLRNVMSAAADIARSFWPFSPAEQGPLSGKGDPFIAGQKVIQRIAMGMEMEAPRLAQANENALTNISFGPGAVRVTFEGALPSDQQALSVGSAVGQGIMGQLAARDTRLAVRTL